MIRQLNARLAQRVRRLCFLFSCRAAGLPPDSPVFTVTSSNGGRSVGDVFLALASVLPRHPETSKPVFVTHPNHVEIVGWFAHRLGLVLTPANPENWARAARARNIHWGDNDPDTPENARINNPWRFFHAFGTSPHDAPWRIPVIRPRITGKSVLVFPERGDNNRLPDHQFAAFINTANKRGYSCYTNTFVNSNFSPKPPLPGTKPLANVSLSELVNIARDPDVVFLGTRSGFFDILYLTTPRNGATLAILYPDTPSWIWDARLLRPDLEPLFGDRYLHRPRVHDIPIRDFDQDKFFNILT
jgi:hypothetical protein